MLEHHELTRPTIGAFYRVYDGLGYGHFEAVYGAALEMELREVGLPFRREAPVEVWYRGRVVGNYRADFVVDDRVVIELKATHALDVSARRQLFNYLKSSDMSVGLLLHFGPTARFHRIVHTRNGGRTAP